MDTDSYFEGCGQALEDCNLPNILKDTLDAINWYMDNSTPEAGCEETFFNLGANLIEQIENIIENDKIRQNKNL